MGFHHPAGVLRPLILGKSRTPPLLAGVDHQACQANLGHEGMLKPAAALSVQGLVTCALLRVFLWPSGKWTTNDSQYMGIYRSRITPFDLPAMVRSVVQLTS